MIIVSKRDYVDWTWSEIWSRRSRSITLPLPALLIRGNHFVFTLDRVSVAGVAIQTTSAFSMFSNVAGDWTLPSAKDHIKDDIEGMKRLTVYNFCRDILRWRRRRNGDGRDHRYQLWGRHLLKGNSEPCLTLAWKEFMMKEVTSELLPDPPTMILSTRLSNLNHRLTISNNDYTNEFGRCVRHLL